MFARFQAKLSNRFDRPKTAPPPAFQGSASTIQPAVGGRERGRQRVVSLQLTCASADSEDSPGIISVRDYTRRQSESAAVMSTVEMLEDASQTSQPSQAPVSSHSATFSTVLAPAADQRWSNGGRMEPKPVRSLNAEEPNALGLYEPLVRTSPGHQLLPGVNTRPNGLRVPLAAVQSATSPTPRMAAAPSHNVPAHISTPPPDGNPAAPRSRLKRMRSITHVPEHLLLHPHTAAAPSTKFGDDTLFDDNQGFGRHVKFRAGTKEEDGLPQAKVARRARISRERMSVERALADEVYTVSTHTGAPRVPDRPVAATQFQPGTRLPAPPSSSRPVAAPPTLRPHSVDIGGQALSVYGIHAREVDRAPFVPAKFIPRGYAPERGWTPGGGTQEVPMARYSETQTEWQQKEARMAVHIVSDVHGAETLHDWMAGARYAYTACVPVSGRT